jgi:hypothetical protein
MDIAHDTSQSEHQHCAALDPGKKFDAAEATSIKKNTFSKGT